MWVKLINTRFKGMNVQVLIWLADTDENGKETVRVQSMINEYFLIEDILFQGRDSAHDFIKNYPVAMANAFLIREAYANSAIE